MGGAAFAQEADEETPVVTTPAEAEVIEESGDREKIVVTGSRIRRDEFSSASPLQVITSEASTLAGLIDTSEILQSSTIASGSTQINNFFTGFVVNGGPGVNTVSLRGLGSQRTLVLINGRRLNPAGTRGQVAAVDLNTIPDAIIQRIEILNDGASSIYGSDAVAGVVNVITKDDVEGVWLSGTANKSFEDGGDRFTWETTFGGVWDRGSLNASFSYEQIDPLRKGDRPELFMCDADYIFDGAGNRADDLAPLDDEYADEGLYKCYNTPNYIVVRSLPSIRFEPGTGVVDTFDPLLTPGGDYIGADGQEFVNVQSAGPGRDWWAEGLEENDTVISPAKRISFSSFGTYEISDNVELFGEFMFNNRRSQQDSHRQFFPDFPASHPDNPWGQEFGFAASPLTVIPYGSYQQVDTFRALAGARGDFGDGGGFLSDWDWEAFYSYGHAFGRYGFDAISATKVELSIDLVEVDANGDPDPGSGVWDCRSNAYSAGTESEPPCVPFRDPFTAGALSGDFDEDLVAYLFTPDYGTTTYDQHLISGILSGELFDVPAGAVSTAIGFEWRQESIDDQPGALSSTYDLWGFTSAGRTMGTDTVQEVFGEVEIPLVRGQPLIEDLTLNLSGRYTDYESGYSGETYKVTAGYQPVDWLRFRATHGTSFRAPALYELFLGGQTAFSSASDPCEDYDNVLDPGYSPIVEANCLSEGLPGGWPGYSSTPRVITFGNEGRLDAETSEATTFGIVFQPDFFLFAPATRRLSAALDYWSIEVKDEVGRYGAQTIINNCYADPAFRTPGGFCDFVSLRDGDGEITEINDSYFNISGQKTEGIDFTLRFEQDFAVGDFLVDWRNTWTTTDEIQTFTGGDTTDFNGVIGEPSYVSQLDFRFYKGPWTFFYGMDYIWETSDNKLCVQDIGLSCDDTWDVFFGLVGVTRTDDYLLHDASIRYEKDMWALQVGLQNIFDEDPPRTSAALFSDQAGRIGTTAFATQYDLRGRRGFVTVSRRF